MKTQNQRSKKKKGSKKADTTSTGANGADPVVKSPEKKASKQKSGRPVAKKSYDRKGGGDRSISKVFSKSVQFLREAKLELKKVKWPTRKELLASTAVVIVLTLFIAFYLGLVDFGLIKIIRSVVG